jgi:integrase
MNAAENLQARAILMLLYSTGTRRSELVRLRVEDIDTKRMIFTSARARAARTAMWRCARGYWKHCASTGSGGNQRLGFLFVAPHTWR